MNNALKSHADIVAEMESGPIPEHRHDREILRYYAHSLDLAHKREIDALNQRRTELDAEVAAKDEVIKRLNDAISEEQRRKMATAEKSSAVGDCAKLHEAIEAVLLAFNYGESTIVNQLPFSKLLPMLRKCVEALAAPPRQCDIGTAEEQSKRCFAYCNQYICKDCPCNTIGRRTLVWAQMPYEEGGAR
jgi:hypothetical protein